MAQNENGGKHWWVKMDAFDKCYDRLEAAHARNVYLEAENARLRGALVAFVDRVNQTMPEWYRVELHRAAEALKETERG